MSGESSLAEELQSLAYVSSATVQLSADDLLDLLDDSRAENERLSVTGVLLFSGGNFMQVLEGPPTSLDHVMGRIRASRRHKGITELYREPITTRDFPDWRMAFRRVDAANILQLQQAGSGDGAIRQLLRQFWAGQR